MAQRKPVPFGQERMPQPWPRFMPVELRSGYYARNIGPLTLPEARAVCRLAAAAPAMLEALEGIKQAAREKLQWAADHYEEGATVRVEIEAMWRPVLDAVAKAKGDRQ